MHLFYTEGVDLFRSFNAGEIHLTLSETESAHVKVMRLKSGDQVLLTDGLGCFAQAVVDDVHHKKSVVRLTSVDLQPVKPYKIRLAVAPTKNISRYEWFVEKAVEIGVDEIIPLWCDHSERERLRVDRLEKVAVAAMKQSLKAKLPFISEPVSIDAELNDSSRNDARFIAWIDDTVNTHLKTVCPVNKDITVLIGPEGDFSPREVKAAVDRGFIPVSLGKSRLRTETAALAACMIINLINE